MGLDRCTVLFHLAMAASAMTRKILTPSVRAFSSSASRRFQPFHPIVLSPHMIQKSTRHILENIDLMVLDMAGTTVNEGGVVYQTLQRSMRQHGLDVSEAEIEPWHGAKKEAVIEHFANRKGLADAELEPLIMTISDTFVKAIEESYFGDDAQIAPIDVGLMGYFQQLRDAGIKIGLDTGYPQNIQNGLVKKLGFDKIVDGWISSYDVAEGRPFPYMIHRLMERLNIEDVRRVAKVGDSARDMEEGVNAGCGLVVGVLSGADSAEDLFAAGADVVANCVTDLPVPRKVQKSGGFRLPDLS